MVTIIVPKEKKVAKTAESIPENSVTCATCGRETVFGLRKQTKRKDGTVENKYVCLLCISKGKFV